MPCGIVDEMFIQDDDVLRRFTSNSKTSCLRSTEEIAVAVTDGKVRSPSTGGRQESHNGKQT